MPEQDIPLIERLETGKRTVLLEAINEFLPGLAQSEDGKDLAEQFARQTLEDIQEGNNPDLEPQLRERIQELGIRL